MSAIGDANQEIEIRDHRKTLTNPKNLKGTTVKEDGTAVNISQEIMRNSCRRIADHGLAGDVKSAMISIVGRETASGGEEVDSSISNEATVMRMIHRRRLAVDGGERKRDKWLAQWRQC